MGSVDSPLSAADGPAGWRPIGWNGIRLMAPADWQIARLAATHLVLEAEGHPVLEIKWGQQRGRFSARRYLEQVARQNGLRLGKELSIGILWPQWQKALSGYQVSAFSWQRQNLGGRGGIVYCPECRTVSLIQFFISHSPPADGLVGRILSSFQDHGSDQQRLWAIYDIQARLPEAFRLVQHRLVPGAFELSFHGPRATRLSLYRWAPASVLLAQTTLTAFAQKRLMLGLQPATITQAAEGQCVDFSIAPEFGLWRRITGRLGIGTAEGRVRLWHVPPRNRLLGIRLEAEIAQVDDWLERIYAAYGCV